MSKEIFSRWQDPTIEKLQQENQQLKENYKTIDEAMSNLIEEKQQYKSVLNEIRECTRKYCSGIFTDDGEIVFVTPTANIVQILDKVKE